MIPILKSVLFSGFAVVFAEDVPDVPSQVIPTGKLFSGFCLL